MSQTAIYLDHAATTSLDERVLETMLPVLRMDFGNASSVHRLGRKARYLVESARETVAGLIGAKTSEIVFTSGGTEANNSAVLGCQLDAVISTLAEHESVLRSVEWFERNAGVGSLVAVKADGRVDTGKLEAVLQSDESSLVSVMMVNNETGTLNDIRHLADIVHERGDLLHTDAVQAGGLIPIDVETLGVDLMTLSGHKFYGPKGVGLLYVRSGTPFDGTMLGGSQEQGRRAGTENVAAIVGFAKALELACREMADRARHCRSLQQRLLSGISDMLGSTVVHNTPATEDDRAPHIVNIAFPPLPEAVDGEMLLLGLDMEGICVSSGSACTSGAIKPSHVLLAMGRDKATAHAAIRFSVGKDTTDREIDLAVEALVRVYSRVAGKERAFA